MLNLVICEFMVISYVNTVFMVIYGHEMVDIFLNVNITRF